MFTNALKNLSKVIDLGQGSYRHSTKAKKVALETAGNGKCQQALDFGCGDGFWSEKLKQRGWQVTATDNYDARYKESEKVDAENLLPFKDNQFDLIWSSEVIEHVYNVERLIEEFRRIVKPGGRLIVTTPNSGFWIYSILGLMGITPKQAQNPDHKQFFRIEDLKKLFPQADIYGYFPYVIVKFMIKKGIGVLSPTFLIVEKVNKNQ